MQEERIVSYAMSRELDEDELNEIVGSGTCYITGDCNQTCDVRCEF